MKTYVLIILILVISVSIANMLYTTQKHYDASHYININQTYLSFEEMNILCQIKPYSFFRYTVEDNFVHPHVYRKCEKRKLLNPI